MQASSRCSAKDEGFRRSGRRQSGSGCHRDYLTVFRVLSTSRFITRGKARLDQRLDGFNKAARHYPWIVLRDLDEDAVCAGELCSKLLGKPSRYMCLRVAVHEVEAWLLADQERFLSHFKIRKPPDFPENFDVIQRPKDLVLRMIESSRSKDIREDMLVRKGSGAHEGPAYSSRVAEFASIHWRPEIAARKSASLKRSLSAIEALAKSI